MVVSASVLSLNSRKVKKKKNANNYWNKENIQLRNTMNKATTLALMIETTLLISSGVGLSYMLHKLGSFLKESRIYGEYTG